MNELVILSCVCFVSTTLPKPEKLYILMSLSFILIVDFWCNMSDATDLFDKSWFPFFLL